MDRSRRGTWAVSSVNVQRVQRYSSQKNLRLVQITSTAPATGMSRTRCGRRECTRVLITPQDGQPAWAVASALIRRCPKAMTSVSVTR